MIIIKLKEGETLEKALRRYKKKFEKTGVLKEVRARMFYDKPSEARKKIIQRAMMRQKHYNLENA